LADIHAFKGPGQPSQGCEERWFQAHVKEVRQAAVDATLRYFEEQGVTAVEPEILVGFSMRLMREACQLMEGRLHPRLGAAFDSDLDDDVPF